MSQTELHDVGIPDSWKLLLQVWHAELTCAWCVCNSAGLLVSPKVPPQLLIQRLLSGIRHCCLWLPYACDQHIQLYGAMYHAWVQMGPVHALDQCRSYVHVPCTAAVHALGQCRSAHDVRTERRHSKDAQELSSWQGHVCRSARLPLLQKTTSLPMQKQKA